MGDELSLSEHQTLRVDASTPEALIVESRWGPGGPPPRTHWHPTQHEHFEVLEGALTVSVAGRPTQVLTAGDVLDIPPRTTHRMWNASSHPTRARWSITPRQRSEEMFRELARRPNLLASIVILWRYRREIRLGSLAKSPHRGTAGRAG